MCITVIHVLTGIQVLFLIGVTSYLVLKPLLYCITQSLSLYKHKVTHISPSERISGLLQLPLWSAQPKKEHKETIQNI